MPFFQVDDQFHSHPKTAWLSDSAVALWTRAGSHCAAYLTDGFIDDATVRRLGGKPSAVNQLLTIRAPFTSPLWLRVEGGYQFHDWDQYQPVAAVVKKKRREAVERMQRVRANKPRTFEDGSQKVRLTQSIPYHSIPVNTVDNVSHLVKREDQIDVDKIIVAIQKNCGRDCTPPMAFLVIGTIMERAKSAPKNKTAFVKAAIERDPFEFQKIIDELVAI